MTMGPSILGNTARGYDNSDGVFSPGWQYPIDRPGAAVRNKMRETGTLGNPFNKTWMDMVDRFALSMLPQFLSSLGSEGDLAYLESGFGDFLGKGLRGEVSPWTMGQATSNLGSLQDRLLSGMKQYAGQGEGNLLAGQSSGPQNPINAALIGLLTDPRMQQALFYGGLGPSLGPALTKGLHTAMGPTEQAWDDYGEAASGPNFQSLLGVLLGKPGISGNSPRSTTPLRYPGEDITSPNAPAAYGGAAPGTVGATGGATVGVPSTPNIPELTNYPNPSFDTPHTYDESDIDAMIRGFSPPGPFQWPQAARDPILQSPSGDALLQLLAQVINGVQPPQIHSRPFPLGGGGR